LAAMCLILPETELMRRYHAASLVAGTRSIVFDCSLRRSGD
jgi:hypothetical protein